MSIRQQLAIARARFPILVLGMLVAGIPAFLFASSLPRIYQASATMIVGESVSGANPDYNALLAGQRLSATYALLATTRPLLDRVVQQLRLSEPSDAVAGRIQATGTPDTDVLTITARDRDPAAAAALANAVATELIASSPTVQGQEADFQHSINKDIEAIRRQIDQAQADMDGLLAIVPRTPEQQRAVDTLAGRLTSLRSTYASFLAYTAANASNRLTLVQPAVPATTPVTLPPLFYAALAAVVGLLLATGVVFLLEYREDRVRDPSELDELTGAPTLGAIGRGSRDETGAGDGGELPQLPTLTSPRSRSAEAYRSLRLNIQAAFAAGRAGADQSIAAALPWTIAVSSPEPSGAKTATASNLAVAFAEAGHRVVLVEADLRRPGVHPLFGISNAHQGLTNLLSDENVTIDDVVQKTRHPNLGVVTAGAPRQNPSELLGSRWLPDALGRLRSGRDVDVVIFDAPAMDWPSDVASLGAVVDGVLLVVKAGSRREPIRAAREALAMAGARILGIVLDDTRSPAPATGAPGLTAPATDKQAQHGISRG
ncbi:MAG: tyrosine-protein kinase [Chloroflexota bacterium]|nr:tyrosine-protein kinase [Chloroflexota bacterium]